MAFCRLCQPPRRLRAVPLACRGVVDEPVRQALTRYRRTPENRPPSDSTSALDYYSALGLHSPTTNKSFGAELHLHEGECLMMVRISCAGFVFAVLASVASCQQETPPESRRILGIIPNYRSSPTLSNY